jgi:hypothetical protein
LTELSEGILEMAITPEIKPRITVAADSEYDLTPRGFAAAEARKDRLESTSNNDIFYALIVLVLIAVGYFGYHYYYALTPITPAFTNQSAAPVEPPAAPATPPVTTTTP